MENYYWIAPVAGLAGLTLAALIFGRILSIKVPDGKVKDISARIHSGAMVFMKREFIVLSPFVLVIALLLYFWAGRPSEAIAFVAGAVATSLSGYIGMYTATKANVRTTVAAHQHGAAKALSTAFFGGSIMGLTVASMGLLGIGLLFYFLNGEAGIKDIHGFAMGASLVAIFFRIGGGIFTKAADVGADLVGKVEAGIPEDDPRNPGVIADNVGDNVGDVAGMGADLFESYSNAQIATMAIAAAAAAGGAISESGKLFGGAGSLSSLVFLPLALATTGLLCAVLGILIVKLSSNREASVALRMGTISAAILFVTASYFVIGALDVSSNVWWAVLSGSIGGIIIGVSTEFYTGGRPMRSIAKSSETGVATVMISGLALGMQSVVIPLITVGTIILIANELIGLYGVGIAAVGMLATIGITMSIDAYGPISDNAGGIAEMGGLGKETRKITDSLDEVGNTTAAIGKGFAIGAAALASLAIIAAFVETVKINDSEFALELSNARVIVGIFFGGLLPFLIASLSMNAVGDAAQEMIAEIRRQFREIPGLLEGKSEPDSNRCVDIATSAALRKMILPGVIAVGAPVLVGFTLGAKTLGGLLVGALLGCVLLALFMANSGGAWDNAKKYVEKGHFGGKNSESHRACVVGDTVGDPLKDTSGPSMNILINMMAIISLVIAPYIAS
jgi:K(+)-stimulated pyrophosphate-energized sodium pump